MTDTRLIEYRNILGSEWVVHNTLEFELSFSKGTILWRLFRSEEDPLSGGLNRVATLLDVIIDVEYADRVAQLLLTGNDSPALSVASRVQVDVGEEVRDLAYVTIDRVEFLAVERQRFTPVWDGAMTRHDRHLIGKLFQRAVE